MKKKLQFRVGGANIDVTTLQRNQYFFQECVDVFSVLHGFEGKKIQQKSMQNAKYIQKSYKKVAIPCGRETHRCHHAAAK